MLVFNYISTINLQQAQQSQLYNLITVQCGIFIFYHFLLDSYRKTFIVILAKRIKSILACTSCAILDIFHGQIQNHVIKCEVNQNHFRTSYRSFDLLAYPHTTET